MIESGLMEQMACPLCGKASAALCVAELFPGGAREIVRCAGCGSAFYNPAPDGADLSKCYEGSYYGGFRARYWKDYRKGLRLGEELRRIKPSGRYLDAGCALGTMQAGVRDASGWETIGTEFSAETARAGRELNGVNIIPARTLGEAGLEAGSVDYVFANNVIEHLPDPAGFLAEAAALLAKGGLLRLITPNGASDIAPNKLLWGRKKAVLATRHCGHIWFFTPRALRMLAANAGFKTESFRSFHFIDALKSRGLWPGALARFERRRGGRRPPPPASEYPAIPPETGRFADAFLARWRGLLRLPVLTFGADFDILLRKL